jgi:hypothetical protein
MTELILSDITVMGQGYCMIGLEQISAECYRSVRPVPPWGFAWRDPFPFRRGDRVTTSLRRVATKAPHFEDGQSDGLRGLRDRMAETDLVQCLKKAEVAQDLERLFECPVKSGSQGGGAFWVDPSSARRSICGCEYENLRFRVFPEPGGYALRSELVLRSNQRIPSIPIVDRAWRRFVGALVKQVTRAEPLPLVERFLNRTIFPKLLTSLDRFARIGLPRPREDRQCWLMLDSLFPQPQRNWLDLM